MTTPQGSTPCPSCGKPIRWAVTAAGRRQALNANPDPTGNAAAYTDGTGRLRVRALTGERPALEHAEWRAMPPRRHLHPPPAPPRRAPADQRRAARAVAGVAAVSTTRATAPEEHGADWREFGLCRQVDPELWWPEKGSSTAAARKICTACEVRTPCLDWALETGEPGVWGGTTPNQRKAIRRARSPLRQAAEPPRTAA
ncbi:WhiB family transcriptional regulator [Streptomyces sp. NPDC094032]|uniref:WhiB family transcriptional regulator n=1 Tax=Streptomyces sp. NPDC094032 TaxID=3155308 RepID=UPI00332FC638